MKNLLTALLFCLPFMSLLAQDTFSIVAVDTASGEVGSAGASCLDSDIIAGGVSIIGDLIPGKGAINTQSLYLGANQIAARNQMLQGASPTQIINYLILNDAQNDSTVRQYGIVDFAPDGSGRAAAFTGSNCFDYKNQIVGDYYAIQGNILLGQEILDSMEYYFLQSSGSLAERLMAALQGANVPGADSRCQGEGVSSQSAFLRVARSNDVDGQAYLDLVVAKTPFGVEPIDSLQILFDSWTSPNCNFVIPNDVVQLTHNWDTLLSSQHLWVCSGDSLWLSGNFNTVYMETGAAYFGGLGGLNTIYIPQYATYDGGNQTINSIFYVPGSILLEPGPAVQATSCDTLTYDYSNAPVSLCSPHTNLSDPFLNIWRLTYRANTQTLWLHRKELSLPGELLLFDLQGRLFRDWKIEGGQSETELSLAGIQAGVYLLQWKSQKRSGAMKLLIP